METNARRVSLIAGTALLVLTATACHFSGPDPNAQNRVPEGVGTQSHPNRPPANPPANVAADPAYTLSAGRGYQVGSALPPCWSWVRTTLRPDPDASGCLAEETAALDHALSLEGLGPVTLPHDFVSLSVEEQLFVIADLERTVRGEPPVLGMSPMLHAAAQAGAIAGADPILNASSLPAATSWGSNWAGNNVNALDADYGWMYEDGWDGPKATTNVDCNGPEAAGCWGHRDVVLMTPGTPLVMGAGFATNTDQWMTSFTELFVAVPDRASVPPLSYTWAEAASAGAAP